MSLNQVIYCTENAVFMSALPRMQADECAAFNSAFLLSHRVEI